MSITFKNTENLFETLEYAKEKYPEQMANIAEQIDLLLDDMHSDICNYTEDTKKSFNGTGDYEVFDNLHEYAGKMRKIEDTLKEISHLILPEFSLTDEIIDEEISIEHNEEENIKINYNDKRYSADYTIPHTLYETFTFTRPVMIEIDGNKIEVSEWKEMFRAVCEYLFIQNPKKFVSFLSDESMRGKKRVWFSTNKSDVASPMPVSNSGVYIMGNVSAMFVRNIIIKMFERFSIPKYKCKIYLGRDFTELHRSNTLNSDKGLTSNLMTETNNALDCIPKNDTTHIKIGKYARDFFEEYFSRSIDEKELYKFLNKEWCHSTFGICYPILKKIDKSIPISKQIGYNNKYNRYYAKELTINNNSYLLCSQWFEEFRPKLETWINSHQSSKNTSSLSQSQCSDNDMIYFGNKSNSFHLLRKNAISIFKYMRSECKKYDRFDSSKLAKKYANKMPYDNPTYAVGQLIRILMKNEVVSLSNGHKRLYYTVINQTKISKLIEDPETILTQQWDINNNLSNQDIDVYIIKKDNQKCCPNCLTTLEKHRLQYHIYADIAKSAIDFERNAYTKKCPNCNKIFMTEGTHDAIMKQQRKYIDKSNLNFIK